MSREEDGMIEVMSPIQQLMNDFVNSRPYIRPKIKNGKASCDRCGANFMAIHPTFICRNDSDEELLCYLCNYKRLGTSVEEVYRSKRSDEERVMLEIQSKNNASKGYERKKTERKKKEKKQEPVIKRPDLFSELS